MLMRQMRQNTKIIMLVTAIAFVALMVFEWGMDMSGQTAGGDLGRVGRTAVPVQQYQTVYRNLYNQIQESQNQPISSQQDREIEDMAWDEVVNQILIQQELNRRGIRVSDEEIRQAARFSPPPALASDPAFQTNGQFDLERYQQWLSQTSQTDPRFLQELEMYYRDILPREKLARQVMAGIYVSDRELWERWRQEHEQVEVTILAIDPDGLVSDSEVEVTRGEIERYYEENREEFRVPARATVRYLYLDQAPAEADSIAARERAEQIRAEILDEGDFAEIALRESVDQESSLDGGEIGPVSRDDLPPPVAEAAFTLPLGSVSEPIETEQGYHLIEVLTRDEDEGVVELRQVLLPISRSSTSEIRLLTRADSLETIATEQPLEDAAEFFGLTVMEGEISQDFPILAGVGFAEEGRAWIFEERESGESVSPLFENPDAFYILEVLREYPAAYLGVDDVAEEIEATLRARYKIEQASEQAREWASELRSGASFEELAETVGGEVQSAGPFTRGEFVPGLGQSSTAIGTAFGTAEGSIGGPIASDNRVVLLRVDRRIEPDREEWETQKEIQRAQVTGQIQQDRLEKWIEGLRETTRIVDGRAEYFRALDEQEDQPQIPLAF